MRKKPHAPAVAAVLGIVVLIGQSAPALATYEKEEAEIQALVGDAKYQSAATYIYDHPNLRAEPRFIRLYTHLLTTQYVFTINFDFFGLKDLKKGERVEDYRGKKGTYQLIGGPLEELLYQSIKKNPDSPDLNFAIGEYLSRGETCGCREPRPLRDLKGDDGTFFLKAEKGGVADAWSLFRIGVHQQNDGQIDNAIAYYKKSLALDPNSVDATYNIAAAYFAKQDDQTALRYAEKALGKYNSNNLNADTYHLHGAILDALKRDAEAEKSLEQALKLQPWHGEAFATLLGLYRRTRQDAKYIQHVQDFIALDYGNTYTFNAYVSYLQKAGQTDSDRKIEKALLALKPKDEQQNGALYFNLARMADLRSDKIEALRRYERSLAAFKTMKEPPEGAIPAVTRRIQELAQK